MPIVLVRVALVIGFSIDVTIAIFALFFQAAMGPLLDIPLKDPAATTIAGGEFLVVALLYLAILRDPQRYRNLLLLVALDQACAVVLPAYEMLRGNVIESWKTLGPLPLQALLAATLALGWRTLATTSPAPPTRDFVAPP